jgi:hypothetical protein
MTIEIERILSGDHDELDVCSVHSIHAGGWVDTVGPVAKAILKKASRYRSQRPFILSINEIRAFASEDHLFSGMFGRRVISVQVGHKGPAQSTFNFCGAIGGPQSPKSQSVSGFLYLPDCSPLGFWRRKPVYAEHPWARHKVGNPFVGMRSLTFDDSGRGTLEGDTISIGQILDIDSRFGDAQ